MTDGDSRHERPTTDRDYLTRQQYADAQNLAARQAIYRYQRPRTRLMDWALDQIDWSAFQGSLRALDIGCGNGFYLRALAGRWRDSGMPGWLLGIDLSRGMLGDLLRGWDDALPRPNLAVGDAQALPLPGASLDLALAMHMLYHVPDIPLAVCELRRVLRPGGTLLASTNSLHDKEELLDVLVEAFRRLGGRRTPAAGDLTSRFALETGAALLETAFARVERRDLERELVIPESAAVVRYWSSLRSAFEPLLPRGITWETLMAEVEQLVDGRIAADGAFRVRTLVGVFVCG